MFGANTMDGISRREAGAGGKAENSRGCKRKGEAIPNTKDTKGYILAATSQGFPETLYTSQEQFHSVLSIILMTSTSSERITSLY